MKLSEFCKKTTSDSLMEPNAIKHIMEKLFELPLEAVFPENTAPNKIDELLLEVSGLEKADIKEPLKFKHLLLQMFKNYTFSKRNDDTDCCYLFLAYWSRTFTPDVYIRKEKKL